MNLVNWHYTEQTKFTFLPLSRMVENWKNEIYNTAAIIASSTDRTIYICMSGGIDGEVIARAFLDRSIPFKAITLEYKNNINDHDISYAKKFCQENNIQHEIIELDLHSFIQNDIPQYISKGFYATNVHRYIELRLIDEVESRQGCAIFGGGDQIFYTHQDKVCLTKSEDDAVVLNYMSKYRLTHFNEFFDQNSEIFYSWLKEPIIEIMTNDPDYYRFNLKLSVEKIPIYHKYWRNMEYRRKYTGFEKVVELRLSTEHQLSQQFPHFQQILIPISKVKQDLQVTNFYKI